MKTVFIFSILLLFLLRLGGCDRESGRISVSSSRPEDFRDYRSWRIVDYTIGQSNPFLGGAHRGADERWVRRIYLHVPSSMERSRYPPGTSVLKETYTWENGVQKFDSDGISAMVKRDGPNNPDGDGWEWVVLTPDLGKVTSRGGPDMGMCNSCHANAERQESGGDFNPLNRGWEWFILDPETRRPQVRGDNLGNGACSACHRSAAERGTGRDYVFRHRGDPFNN